MRIIAIFGSIAALTLTAPGALAEAPAATPSLRLEPGAAVRVDRNAAASEAALNRDWGQFEFSLPKSQFPIPAPNCKSRVRLRLIALPPQAENREVRLAERWRLLQALRELESGEPLRIELELDLRHYVQHRPGSGPQLRYCNAFSGGAYRLTRD